MKIIRTAGIAAAAAACLAAVIGVNKFVDFGGKGNTPVVIDNSFDDAVPELSEIAGMTESKALSALSKYSYDDLARAWGEPQPLSGSSDSLDGMWSSDGRNIYIGFYKNDRTVRYVRIKEIQTGISYTGDIFGTTEEQSETAENDPEAILERIAQPALDFYGHFTGGGWSYGDEVYALDGEAADVKYADLSDEYSFHTADEMNEYLGNYFTEEAAAQFTPADGQISGDKISSRYSSMLISVDGDLYACVSGKCGYLMPDFSKAGVTGRNENEIIFSLEMYYPAENGFMPQGTYNFTGTLRMENGEWKFDDYNIAVLEENELYDIMDFCRLPYFEDLVRMTGDEVKYVLAGYTYDDIKDAWGEPTENVGETGGVWSFDGSGLTLVFDETGNKIESVYVQTVKEINFTDEQLRTLLAEIYGPARSFYAHNWEYSGKEYTLTGEELQFVPEYARLSDDYYFNTAEGMRKFLGRFFTADVTEEIMSSVADGEISGDTIVRDRASAIINVNGDIYVNTAFGRAPTEPDLNTARVISATENEIKFSAEFVYDLDDGYMDKGVYKFYGTLANEEGKWKFSDERVVTADLNNPYSLP